ncbi:ROK family glucokinase [Bacillus sp. ISL-40]|uniref:ROK family glucokinase n=1 Tax=unclassified Bacillus (in: firmicutes) TaxID=185979 RepID=UPI001BE5F844|nr:MULTISPECIES: ROK family glucokinase [unclassified Bacillus (in: firmicutes)]MBT2696549.1 ROK family glucokinase [Bacillus sp. ISL-40]MBT2722181.1 ROK family glucokinase [Bacillus sp. ISL-46]MBT2740750.1 ROK family glucokinase [Bacillus sp. ISL-77]
MDEKWLVGVDVGGTTIKLAFISLHGDIKYSWEIATDKRVKGRYIPALIASSIDQKLNELNQTKNRLIGIGIGAPGPVNVEDGSIEVAVNLGWENFPLQNILEIEASLPVVVDNDANIAAIGEMWKGAGKGAKNLICVTLGTGVGGGIIVNGEIVHGVNGAGGEIGHITSVPKGGSACNCGKSGCLETVASATGIVRLAQKELSFTDCTSKLRDFYEEKQTLTAKKVFDTANEGDEIAKQIIQQVVYHLGLALANLANSLNPEKIVLGGGVSKAGGTLLGPLKEEFISFAFPRVAQGVEIVTATLGNNAGVIGGAWLVKEKLLINLNK